MQSTESGIVPTFRFEKRESSMATDTRATRDSRQLTIADLCQAIESGRISYSQRDGAYEVNELDVRRFRRGRVASPLSLLPRTELAVQDPTSLSC